MFARRNSRAVKAAKKASKYLPELTVFTEEFKKLTSANPLFVFCIPQSKIIAGGAK